MKRRMLLGNIGNYPINIIIGGVAGSISTKYALAAKLSISESIITRFEIVGSDVHARIISLYTIPFECFRNNKEISSFIDLENKCIDFSINAFYDATNLRELKANAVEYLKNSCLRNCPLDLLFEMFSVSQSQQYSLFGTSIKTYNISNNFAICNGYVFHTNSNVEILNLHSVTGIVGSPHQDIANLSSLKELYLPSLETRMEGSTQFLVNLPSCELISMRRFKSFLNNSISSAVFTNLKIGCVIEVNIAMKTANSGSPSAQIIWAKNNRGAIVKFYNDDGSYHSTL